MKVNKFDFDKKLIDSINVLPNTTHHNEKLEFLVLAAMISDDSFQHLALSTIKPDIFYSRINISLFNLINDIANKNPSMPVTVKYEDLTYAIELPEVKNKYPYLTLGHIQKVYTFPYNSESFFNSIEELGRLYKLRYYEPYLIHIASAIKKNNFDLNKFLKDFDDIRNELRLNDINYNDFVTQEKVENDIWDEIYTIRNSDDYEFNGIPSGFENLDDFVKGFKPGQMIVLAARPGVGKTAFALNIAANIANLDKKVIFISLEMPAIELARRVVSSRTNVPLSDLSNPKLLNEDNLDIIKSNLFESIYKTSTNIYYDADSKSQLDEIVWKIKNFHKQNPELGFVVIDYLQLVGTTNIPGNRQVQVGVISRTIKQLALELKIPILALSQLNRSVESREDNRPQMFDLRESGDIENDADIIIMLSKKKKKAEIDNNQFKNDVDVYVGIVKNRNGAVGHTDLRFKPDIVKFLTVYKKEF